MIMTIQFSRQGMAAIPTTAPVAKSSFVRRLLQGPDDAAKRRVRAWLLEIDDDRLLGFGLTPEDITLSRGTTARVGVACGKNPGREEALSAV